MTIFAARTLLTAAFSTQKWIRSVNLTLADAINCINRIEHRIFFSGDQALEKTPKEGQGRPVCGQVHPPVLHAGLESGEVLP